MDTKKSKPTESQKLGVWLKYRTATSDTVHSLFTSGVQANRILRTINRKRKQSYIDLSSITQRCYSNLDYLVVEGAYKYNLEAVLKHPSMTVAITRGHTDSDSRKVQRYIPTGLSQYPQRVLSHQRMSFHAAKLDNAVLVFCPITGICGNLEMPSLPIALVYNHPLSVAANALTVMSTLAEQVKTLGEKAYMRLERQVLAGMLLSVLSKKHLLREAQGETTAAECNMVLQQAGHKTLYTLLHSIERLWQNPNVWNKMPALNLDWSIHAKENYGGVNIGQTLQAYNKILWSTLEPLSLTSEDQARYLTAKRERSEWLSAGRPPSYIKIHSASAVQARNVKDSKVEARKIFDNIHGQLSVVLQALVGKVIKDLLLLPQSAKDHAAAQLDLYSNTMPALQAAQALELADIIRKAKTERILSEMGSFMQEVSPTRSKSIAEILEAKRLRREEKGANNE